MVPPATAVTPEGSARVPLACRASGVAEVPLTTDRPPMTTRAVPSVLRMLVAPASVASWSSNRSRWSSRSLGEPEEVGPILEAGLGVAGGADPGIEEGVAGPVDPRHVHPRAHPTGQALVGGRLREVDELACVARGVHVRHVLADRVHLCLCSPETR